MLFSDPWPRDLSTGALNRTAGPTQERWLTSPAAGSTIGVRERPIIAGGNGKHL